VTRWRRINTQAEWDAALCALPSPHVLQSWAWGEFKSRWGWAAERWLRDDGRAAFQVTRRKAGPLGVLYASKGPVCADLAGYADALLQLEAMAKRERTLWLKIDGDPPTLPSHSSWRAVRALLTQRGWRFSDSQVQFRNTALSRIDQNDDALLAGMASKCRYNVRLAERRGVTVRHIEAIGESDASALFALYSETAQRDGFLIREKPYYADAWRAMNATAFVAEREGAALGALVLFTFGGRAYYFYGMSRSTGREHMPNHLLQWTALRWARDAGCHTYDWWGAPEQLVESDSMWGVYRFKESFGAQFAEGVGAWDFRPSPLLHAVYTRAIPRILAIMRRRRGSATPAGGPD
jgi:lipid II:glycine glycyltransferase (peptidoglycan interpeptide bridge formation enzyme)